MKDLLTLSQAADMLGVDVRTMRRYANDGLIPVVRLPSRHRRFKREDLEKIIQPKGAS